ncbi:MAG: NAD(+)/NADH kinase, partial [Pseudomonadota bacterium]
MSAAPAGQSFERIAFVASEHDEASAAANALRERYGDTDVADADVVVALGGDGLMLQTLRAMLRSGMPIYGMHRGSVGFLMNE